MLFFQFSKFSGIRSDTQFYNFGPQLRYKNPRVQIDVTTDRAAVPYMTLFFKDGRSATINCSSTAEEIATHVQAAFCVEFDVREEKEDFDENGRIVNPWMHATNKPCSTATVSLVWFFMDTFWGKLQELFGRFLTLFRRKKNYGENRQNRGALDHVFRRVQTSVQNLQF